MTTTEKNKLFCDLITEYRPRLYRIAKGILKNEVDAEDAVSETTYKAYAKFNKLRNLESFKSWIIKILVHESYAISNKRRSIEYLDNIFIENNNSYSENINSFILWDAVQLLNDEFRTVTILFYYEDMKIKDISKILKIPIGTVNSRLNRSRKKLKEIFIQEGVESYESY